MTMPEEHKAELVDTGMAFMRSITDCYGTEPGLLLWDRICEILDPDIKGEIFLAMLTGEYTPGRIRISGITPERVSVIKCIREVTGLGLKESKDLSDEMQWGKVVTIALQKGLSRNYAAEKFRALGIRVI